MILPQAVCLACGEVSRIIGPDSPRSSSANCEDGVTAGIEGLGLARLNCRRPLTRSLAELGRLSLRRFAHMLGRNGVTGFDVTSSHDDRSSAAELLDRFSTLSGQVHAISDDPWRLLWGPDRRAFLPFQERSSTLIAWRDPVGPPEDAIEVIGGFQAYAAARGKHAVLLGMGRDGRCIFALR